MRTMTTRARVAETMAAQSKFAGHTMELTTSADVFDPEVWEDSAQENFVGALKVANSPAVTTDDSLVGKPGSKVTFTKWNLLDEMDDLEEGVAMVPEKLSQTDSEAVIKEAGKAVEYTDTADLVGPDSPGDEALRQFGQLSARKVDKDVIDAMIATGSLTGAFPAGGLTWNAIADGLGLFGDEADVEDFAGLYANSIHRTSLMKDEQFIAAAQGAGENGVVTKGVLGTIGGLTIIITDRMPVTKVAIAKRAVVAVKYKRRPVIEQDRDILARTNVLTTNQHYAVKRVKDKGVAVLTKSA